MDRITPAFPHHSTSTTPTGFTFKGNKHQIRRMRRYISETFGGGLTMGNLSALLDNSPQVRRGILLAGRANA